MDGLEKITDRPIYDVVVIGAGPAGTCAALRLLQLGYQVAIIEQTDFPRPQIGESLSPGIWNIFQYLEAEPILKQQPYLRNLPAHVIWERQVEERIPASQRGPGIMVDRGQLDRDLLDLCRDRGARVFQPAKLEERTYTDDQWTLKIKTKAGKILLQSLFVFDARGRKGIPRAERVQTAPLSIGIWTHFEATHLPEATLVEAMDDAWLWGAPLPNGSFRAMAFVDPETVKTHAVEQRLKELLEASLLFNAAASLPSTECATCPVQSYWNARAWKENYLHLGESAFALDPLSSTGVEKAMRFSLQAVIAFNTIQKKGRVDLARDFYMEKLLNGVATHTLWTQEFYSQSWGDKSSAFWGKRCQPFRDAAWSGTVEETALGAMLQSIKPVPQQEQNPGISIAQTLRELAAVPIQLSPQLSYQKKPCVVGDHLESKEAIDHPGLESPIAYMGTTEIAPLLQNLGKSITLASVIDQWSAGLGRETATRLSISLWGQGIFEKQ